MENIISSINKTLDDISVGKKDISEELIEQFGEDIKQSLRDWATPKETKDFRLRVSNVGQPLRKLWFQKRLACYNLKTSNIWKFDAKINTRQSINCARKFKSSWSRFN